jgi:hypothetical protein
MATAQPPDQDPRPAWPDRRRRAVAGQLVQHVRAGPDTVAPMAKKRTNSPNERRKDRGAATAESVYTPTRSSPWKAIAFVLLGGGAIAGAVVFETERSKPAPVVPMPRGPVSPPAPMSSPGGGGAQSIPQPAGEVPPGKVWSPEHGHWHDAATGQAPQ